MFFILDDENRPFFMRDENNKINYPLLNVFSPSYRRASIEYDSSSGSSDDSEEEVKLDVGALMASQFLREVQWEDNYEMRWNMTDLHSHNSD